MANVHTNSLNGGVVPLIPQFGGSGLNNGANTLAITSNSTIDQDVSTTANPTFVNPIVNNLCEGYTTTATSGGTTTLTVSSTYFQFFTGSSAHTVELPLTSTLSLGFSFYIFNDSSAQLTVQSSGGNLIFKLNPLERIKVVCILISGTTASSWSYAVTSNSIGRSITAQVLEVDEVTLFLADTPYDMESLILGPGKWQVWGNISWINGITGVTANSYGWINDVSQTMPDLSLVNQFTLTSTQNYVSMPIVPQIFTVDTTKNVYISAQSSNTNRTICGFISASITF